MRTCTIVGAKGTTIPCLPLQDQQPSHPPAAPLPDGGSWWCWHSETRDQCRGHLSWPAPPLPALSGPQLRAKTHLKMAVQHQLLDQREQSRYLVYMYVHVCLVSITEHTCIYLSPRWWVSMAMSSHVTVLWLIHYRHSYTDWWYIHVHVHVHVCVLYVHVLSTHCTIDACLFCPFVQLFSGLPSVPEILGLCGRGQSLPVSLVPSAVALTVPRAVTRAMFNQGVQVRGGML